MVHRICELRLKPMNIDRVKLLNKLLDLKKKKKYIEVFKRKTPANSDKFFAEFFQSFSSAVGFVEYSNAQEDIESIIESHFSSPVKLNPFYKLWIRDMSEVCKIFCKFLRNDKISFWIGTHRGCKRFHVDMVPYRLLLTYFGKGTEILPNHAADRNAFQDGKTNNQIVKNKAAIRHLQKWDIAVFKGGNNGILHRTPDSALIDNSSILMRLDSSSFLESLKNTKIQ